MNWGKILAVVATMGLLGCSVYQDWQSRRIANGWLLVAWGMALVWQAWASPGYHFLHPQTPGAQGLAASVGASALMLGMTFVLWQRHVFGAGDAKLLCVLAAWAGPLLTVPLLLLTLSAGGALALAALMWAGQRERLWAVLCGDKASTHGSESKPLPYAVAIAMGTLALYVLISHGKLPLWWYA